MKAAVLKSLGSPLVIEDVPAPVLGTGEVIVDVVATRVLSYMNEVFSGERNYALDLPVIPGPGGIGRVRAIGPDSTKLAVGDWVFCDPTVRSRDDAIAPDITCRR
jgi:NADPH:quinone reductase-like Zn-dependent oxidoreductase